MHKAIPAVLVALMMASAARGDDTVPLTQPAAPPAEAPPTDQPAATEVVQNDPKDPIICKREPPKIGTRVGGMRKVCRKASDWRRLKDRATEGLEGVQDRARAENPPGS